MNIDSDKKKIYNCRQLSQILSKYVQFLLQMSPLMAEYLHIMVFFLLGPAGKYSDMTCPVLNNGPMI